MNIVRVRTLGTLTHPDIKDLIWRAFAKLRYPGTDAGAFYRELQLRIAEDALGIFVGFEGGHPKGLCIAHLPTSCMMLAPQIPIVYSDGTPPLIRQMAARVREWIKDAGFNQALGLNLDRHDEDLEGRVGKRYDLAFCRAFSHFGQPEYAGSLIRFRF